eukprot:3698057-Pleurochrysis_carterae.AAC.1
MASFSALLNKRSDRPSHVIGTLHNDNAGEFLSREFSDFLASRGVHNTTCASWSARARHSHPVGHLSASGIMP